MVDLCTGPHLPSTSLLKAAAVTNTSRAFWRADVSREPLQRVYGITFPDKTQLKEYITRELRCAALRYITGFCLLT
jgi:threonyl-tRNA synthetase